MSETPSAQLSPREKWQQQNDEANERVSQLASDTTQREWLTVTTALARTRQEIGADNGLTLLAMAWVREKRAHGGASWDRLLDMTDDQLAQLHGYPDGDGTDLPTTVQPDPAPSADQIADAAIRKPLGDTDASASPGPVPRQGGAGADSAQDAADTSTSAQAS